MLGERWHLVQAEHRLERTAAREMERLGFATFLPEVLEERRAMPARMLSRAQRAKPPRMELVQVLAFPGYAFVQFDPDCDPWGGVTRVPGVRRLFADSAGRPAPLPDSAMDRMRKDMADRLALTTLAPLLDAGARVRVTDGPFADHVGVCLWSDAQRVRVLLELFGRSSPTTLPRRWTEAA